MTVCVIAPVGIARRANVFGLLATSFFHESPNKFRDFVCFGIEREMSGIKHVHFSLRHVFAISRRLAWTESEIVPTRDDENLRLRLLHPRLPFRISIDVGPMILKEVALNVAEASPRLSVRLRDRNRPSINFRRAIDG